jgi:osmotically-inducible protein OsmY
MGSARMNDGADAIVMQTIIVGTVSGVAFGRSWKHQDQRTYCKEKSMATHTATSERLSRRRMLFAAGLVVAALAGCAGSQTKESTGEFVDDSAITAKVKTALLDDKVTRALEVHVETFKGTVELSGFVTSVADKDRAAEVASSVKGVNLVNNGLVVRSRPSASR